MIAEHLSQLRRTLQEADSLPESTKNELLRLVAAAEAEAEGATGETEAAAESAVEDGDADPTVLDQLKSSLEEIESSHPEAAALVSRMATVLANMGI